MFRQTLIGLALALMLFFPLPRQAEAITLEELETKVNSGLNALEALASLEEYMARTETARTSWSPSLFAAGGFLHSKEPVSAGRYETTSYEQGYQRVGLRVPLVAGWAQKRIAELDSRSAAANAQQRLESIQAANLTALRKAWAIRWTEKQKRLLLKDFISESSRYDRALRERLEAQLLLPSRYQALAASFSQARHMLALSEELDLRAKTIIRQSTGVNVPLADIITPDLPVLSADVSIDGGYVDSHPEVVNLDQAAELAGHKKGYAKWAPLDVYLEGTLGFTQDHPGANGNSQSIGVGVAIPLNFWWASQNATNAADAQSRRARQTALLKREELSIRLEQALAARKTAYSGTSHAADMLAASKAGYQTSLRRNRELDTENLERLLDARLEYLRTSIQALDAINFELQARADVLDILEHAVPANLLTRRAVSFEPEVARIFGNSKEKRLKKKDLQAMKADKTISRVMAVYIWNAAPFLSEGRNKQLGLLEENGFNRLLLSLNNTQINALEANPKPLEELLAATHQKGFKVELLLGEPLWLLPQYRQDLKDIVARLSTFAFDGVHLDIEPYQLPDYAANTSEYARLTAQTINEIASVSRWPVSCSLHPLFFDLESPAPELVETLDSDAVSYVALTAYISNRTWLIERIRGILDRHQNISFVLAQSIELDQGAEVSLASKGKAAFMRHLGEIMAELEAPNFKGLAVQAWEDFLRVR